MEQTSRQLCVPELPDLWRTHYAQLRYCTGFISSEELFGPGDQDKERFSLGAYARLMGMVELVETECHGVWLMASDEDYRRTVAAIRDLYEHGPFSAADIRVILALAAEEDVASQLEQRGQGALVRDWQEWIDSDDVEWVRLACQALDDTLGNALAHE